jgi:hypothetical protein
MVDLGRIEQSLSLPGQDYVARSKTAAFRLLSFTGIALYSQCITLNEQGFLHQKLLRRHLSFAAQGRLPARWGTKVVRSFEIWSI